MLFTLTNIVLATSAISLIFVGVMYLVSMKKTLGKHLPNHSSATLKHVIRSAYSFPLIAFSLLFILGIFVPSLTYTALVAVFVLMSGFAIGRLASMYIDGRPWRFFFIITAIEIIYSLLSAYILFTQY
jgi:hydrogenase/urease accessory protein HupE